MTGEMHGLVSEIVSPYQGPLEAVIDGHSQPAVAEAAMVVAKGAAEDESVNRLLLAAIVATYATPANSYALNSVDDYLGLATRAASGLVALEEGLPQDEDHYELALVVPEDEEDNSITGGSVGCRDLTPSILNNAPNGLQASVKLHFSAASKATQRPGTALVDISEGESVTVLRDGSRESVARLEAAVANNSWLTVGGEAVRKRLGPLNAQKRLMALTALRASGVNVANFRGDGCNIEPETRGAVVRDMTRLLVDEALRRNHVRENANDTPPEVPYDQSSMRAMCSVLPIGRDDLSLYVARALGMMKYGHSSAEATTLTFATMTFGRLLRGYPS